MERLIILSSSWSHVGLCGADMYKWLPTGSWAAHKPTGKVPSLWWNWINNWSLECTRKQFCKWLQVDSRATVRDSVDRNCEWFDNWAQPISEDASPNCKNRWTKDAASLLIDVISIQVIQQGSSIPHFNTGSQTSSTKQRVILDSKPRFLDLHYS